MEDITRDISRTINIQVRASAMISTTSTMASGKKISKTVLEKVSGLIEPSKQSMLYT